MFKRRSPWLRWLPYYETFGRVLFAMVLLLMVVGFIVAGFNTLAPMSVWRSLPRVRDIDAQ